MSLIGNENNLSETLTVALPCGCTLTNPVPEYAHEIGNAVCIIEIHYRGPGSVVLSIFRVER